MAHELSGLFVCQSEVLDVCITEYNEKAFVDGILEEGELKRLIKQTCKKCRSRFLQKKSQMILQKKITLPSSRKLWMRLKLPHRNMM